MTFAENHPGLKGKSYSFDEGSAQMEPTEDGSWFCTEDIASTQIDKQRVREILQALEEEFFLIIGETDNSKAIAIHKVLRKELRLE